MNKNAQTILVTGGTGFLGSNLLKKLADTKAELIVLIRDNSKLTRLLNIKERLVFYNLDQVRLDQIFSKHRPDLVIHCATNYGTQLLKTTEIIDSNLLLPLHLLEHAVKYNTQAFINTDTILDRRINSYSLSKKQFLDWLKIFSTEMLCVNASVEHFYGPFDNVTKFTSKIIHSMMNQVEGIDLTPGQQQRDFIYIADVVDAFLKLIEFSKTIKSGFQHFEIGSGKNISIKDFVLLVKKVTKNDKTKLNFGAVNYRENEVMVSRINLESLLTLGWSPKYELEAGLIETITTEWAL